MLVRIGRNQVGNFVEEIRATVISSAAPAAVSEDTISRIFSGLDKGSMQAWIYQRTEDTLDICILTLIVTDHFQNKGSLLVYAIRTFNKVADEDWVAMINGLRKVASAKKLVNILGYTDSQSIIKRVENDFGGKVTSMVEVPV